MKLYNTLTRQTEEFDFTDKIKIYACGPTVYNFIHIGNARPICIFDVLRRYLKYKFSENSVVFVQNFTDVDDKIIRKANEENISVKELTDKYIKEYFTDAHGLNVLDSDIHPRVSENIDAIIGLIEKIIANGYAYEVNGDVYFAVKKFNEYGKLSGKNTENLLSGARVDVDEKKSDPLDFALWKAAKPGEPFWESPW
ncbi:MAG: class I tRNA ligase family protein, partial [Oscillospiraceae bacterium]|nr:class I tRNA ligase family protein [Oscillospiraceae bacterium]